MKVDTVTASQPRAGGVADEEPVLHIVGKWQSFLDVVVRLKCPRALCGELLRGDPDRPGGSPGAPVCSRCLAVGGLPGTYVAGHWLPGQIH